METAFSKYDHMVTDSDRQRLLGYFEASKRPIIFGHISPDGDSVGSCTAVYHYFKNKGKAPVMAMSGQCANNLRFLAGSEAILFVIGETVPEALDDALRECDLFISLDHNAIYRLGAVLAEKVRHSLAHSPRPYICIDHHEAPEAEFDYVLCRPQAAATCEVLSHLFLPWGDVTPEMATCLLTGIITDTGLFNHSSSHPQLFETVAQLLRRGADKVLITDRVFHRFSADRQRLEGYILHEKIHFLPEYKMAYFTLNREEQTAFHTAPGDTEGLVNKPLNIDGVDIAVFFRETLYEGIKVSLRSRGGATVNDIAREVYGGGGHLCAAGAEYAGSMEQAVAMLLRYFKDKKETQQHS